MPSSSTRKARPSADSSMILLVGLPAPWPAHWLQPRAVGNVLMFVDTQFSDDTLRELVRMLCEGVRQIDAKPMTLRSIFTTLAPAARDGVLS